MKASKDNRSTEILYGTHPVSAALAAGRRKIFAVYTTAGGDHGKKRLDPALALAEKAGIPVTVVSGPQLEKMCNATAHQGLAAQVGPYPLVDLDQVPAVKTVSPESLVLIADGILDPHNLGALIRTAACAGVDAVVIPRDNAASPTPAVSKASAGALETMAVARETNISRVVDRLKDKGFWTVGLDSAGPQSLYAVDLTGPVALIVGGEDRGVRRLVREKCDFIVAIPQRNVVNSLNASVAGGIALYEIVRQRTVQHQP